MAAFQASKCVTMFGFWGLVLLAQPAFGQTLFPKAVVERSDAKAWLIAARIAMAAGDLERAELMAGQAERALIGITWVRGPWEDTPAKVRQDIERLKSAVSIAESQVSHPLKNAPDEGPKLPPPIPERLRVDSPKAHWDYESLGQLVSYLHMQLHDTSGTASLPGRSDHLLAHACDLFLHGNYQLAGDLSKKVAASHELAVKEMCDVPRQLLEEIRQARLQQTSAVAEPGPVVRSADHQEEPAVADKTPPPSVAETGSQLFPPALHNDLTAHLPKTPEVAPVPGTIEEECEMPQPPRKSANGVPPWLPLSGFAAVLFLIGGYRLGRKLLSKPASAKRSMISAVAKPKTTSDAPSILIIGLQCPMDNSRAVA